MPYADKDKKLAYWKDYNAKRKESKKEYNRLYRLANREKLSADLKEWSKNNPLAVKGYVLKRRYGVTVEQYNTLFEKQNGCCAICTAHQSQFKKALHLDHCHKTDKIRGLLCVNCNTALGHLKESTGMVQQAIEKDKVLLSTDSKKGVSKFLDDPALLQKAISYLNFSL